MSRKSWYKQKWHEQRKRLLKERASTPPLCPDGLAVMNEAIGAISVTLHAWARFFKRYSLTTQLGNPGWYVPEHFVRKLQDVFGRAKEINLKEIGVVKRLIQNDFVPVRYFLDEVLGLRFVVKEVGVERPALLTVEIAHRK